MEILKGEAGLAFSKVVKMHPINVHSSLGSVSNASFLLLCTRGQKVAQIFGSLSNMPGLEFLALIWPVSRSYRHLRSEPADGKSLSFSLSNK